MKPYVFGIDLGGTTVKIGFFKTDGNLVDKWEIPTRKDNNGFQILPDIAASIRDYLEKKEITIITASLGNDAGMYGAMQMIIE